LTLSGWLAGALLGLGWGGAVWGWGLAAGLLRYVPAPDRDVSAEDLRKALADLLPSYMLPVALDAP